MGFLLYGLTTARLDDVIAAAQASEPDDSPAMNEVVRRFNGLAMRLARTASDSPEQRDELANAARAALVRAVRNHDPRRAGFPSYATHYMRGAVLRACRASVVAPVGITVHPIDDLHVEPSDDGFEDAVVDELAPWGDGPVAEVVASLTPEQRQIANMRYVDTAPLTDIAAATGTTVSAVSQRLSTIHRTVAHALAA